MAIWAILRVLGHFSYFWGSGRVQFPMIMQVGFGFQGFGLFGRGHARGQSHQLRGLETSGIRVYHGFPYYPHLYYPPPGSPLIKTI